MEKPTISVITVTYNADSVLEETILSVINQTYCNIEYIVIDGGSTDGTVDIIKKYQDKISYWISEPDKGIYDAMNKGIDKATGELIGIVNAGDWYQPNILTLVAKLYLNQKGGIIHGNMNFYKNGVLLKSNVKPNLNVDYLYRGMDFFHPTYFVPKEVFNKIGVFNIKNIIASDYEFTVKAYKSSISFIYLDEVISNFGLDGISNQRALLSFKESYRIALRYGYSPSLVRIAFIRKCISYYCMHTPGVKSIYSLLKRVFHPNEYSK